MMDLTVELEKIVKYGIGVKPTTYFKLMYIYDGQLFLAIYGLN